ncbi:PTS EIIC component [Streptococcus pneumoniae]|nr:PTS EIIC component [Streptococcus pneumoniae]
MLMNNVKQYMLAVLNGNALAIMVALVPAALVNQLLGAMPQNGVVTSLAMMVTLAQSALPLIAAFAVGTMLKLGMMETASMALATLAGSGVTTFKDGAFTLAGSGVILNVMLTTAVAGLVAMGATKVLGQLRVVFEPLIVLVVAGGIGLMTLPGMVAVQAAVGQVVASATAAAPLVMGILLGVIFALLIVSPMSSVGIATAIGLVGIGSGAANAGIVAAGLTLAVMGASVNSWGATIAHFMGSPKIQMANLLSRPKLFLPVVIAAAISGGVASLMMVEGTAFSAGFGMAGFIGPLTAMTESTGSALAVRVLVAFVVVPLAAAFLMKLIFIQKTQLIKAEELKLPEV